LPPRQASPAAGLDIDWRIGSSYDLDAILPARPRHHRPGLPLDGRGRRSSGSTSSSRRRGAVALVNTELHPQGDSRGITFEDLRRAHGRFDDFYHWRKSEAWEEHPSVLLRSAFSEVERISIFDSRMASLDEIVARGLSFSANSPSALGEDGRAAYEAAIRDAMLAIEPSGSCPEIVETVAIIARRPL
jgi:hypothetical protein